MRFTIIAVIAVLMAVTPAEASTLKHASKSMKKGLK
jgi:hypothetical protein